MFLGFWEQLQERNFAGILSGFLLGAHQGGHATARFLEGFLEGPLKEVLLRRIPRRRLVRVSIETGVFLRRVLRRGACHRRRLEGRNMPFRRVRPPLRAHYLGGLTTHRAENSGRI